MPELSSLLLRTCVAWFHFLLVSSALMACVAAGRAHHADASLLAELGYAFAHAGLLYVPLQLILLGIYRVGGRHPWTKSLLGSFVVAAVVGVLLANLATLNVLGIVIGYDALSLVREPGFFLTIGIGSTEGWALAAAFLGLFALIGLSVRALENWGPTGTLGVRSIGYPLLLATAGLLGFGIHAAGAPETTLVISRHLPFHGHYEFGWAREAFWTKVAQPAPSGRPRQVAIERSVIARPSADAPSVPRRQLPRQLRAREDWNVLYIIGESLRFDQLTPQSMPEVWELAQDPLSFRARNHFSTGNSTGESMFGIFSGLSPLYMTGAKAKRAYPLVFEIYQALGYQTSLYYTSDLGYTSIDQYVYPADQMRIQLFRRQKGHTIEIWRDDVEAVDALLRDLETGKSNKRVDVIYLWASHYNYYYPPEDAEFSPTLESGFKVYKLADKASVFKLKNRYKNAAHFVDRMTGRLLDGLRAQDLFDRTIIVFLGDHGEEFREHGNVGHSTDLNRYQTQVPLVIRAPNGLDSRYSVSSHADLTPTMLGLLGVDLESADFFTGKDLAVYDPDYNDAMIGTRYRMGLPFAFLFVKDDYKLTLRNRPKGLYPMRMLDLKDRPQRYSHERSQAIAKRVSRLWRHFAAD